MKNQLISVIIPIYNAAPYIIQCLESVYNQTYPNIEVIIIDDCGNDNTMEIIEEYLTIPQRAITTIVHHKKNHGISVARNTGISYAKGEYIYFIDSDDYISSNCIESFVLLAQKYKNPDIVFGTATPIPYKWTQACISSNRENIPEYSNNINWIRKSFSKENFLSVTVWNKLINRNFLIDNKLFFKKGIIYEDNLWNWLTGNYVKTIAFNKISTYFYRHTPNSIVNSVYKEINKDSEVVIIKELFKNIKFRYFLYQFTYILHFSHSSYCRRKADKPLPPAYIRYPKAFIFFIKCLFMKAEKLR